MKKTLLPLITFLFLISFTHEKLNAVLEKNMNSTSVESDSIFIATELLGRPTDKSVTINALAYDDLEVYFEYGAEPSNYTNQTDVKQFPGREPIELIIDKLSPNTRYYYWMCY